MAKPTKRPASMSTTKATARPRTRLEMLSTPVLVRLHGMPRWLFPFFTGALLVGGLLVTNLFIAVTLLGLLMLLLLWLIALSWPLLPLGARLVRGLVLVGLLVVIIGRAQGRV